MSEPPPLPKPIQAATAPPPLPKHIQSVKPRWIVVILLGFLCYFVILVAFAVPILGTFLHWGGHWSSVLSRANSNLTDHVDDDPPTVPPTRILGHVLSVTDDGVLVEQLVVPPYQGPVYFVKGHFDYVDGDSVKLDAYPAGTYKYTTALGAEKTVRAFKARK